MTEDIIPKGPDRKREEEILTLLYDVDQESKIDWQRLINIAQECNEIFQRWGNIKLHRDAGKKGKIRKELREKDSGKLLEEYKKIEKNTWENSLDPFYNPACGYSEDDEGNIKYYYPNDWDASETLKIILSPNFRLPDEIFTEDIQHHYYVLGIKKAFYLMSQQDNPPRRMKTALRLAEILMEIYAKALVFQEQIKQEEKEHDEKAKGRRKLTLRNFNKIKSHRLYPDLIEIMKTYADTREQNRQMDKLISKILGRSEKTLRIYRRMILNDYNKQEKQ